MTWETRTLSQQFCQHVCVLPGKPLERIVLRTVVVRLQYLALHHLRLEHLKSARIQRLSIVYERFDSSKAHS